jgi:hypothetical protein
VATRNLAEFLQYASPALAHGALLVAIEGVIGFGARELPLDVLQERFPAPARHDRLYDLLRVPRDTKFALVLSWAATSDGESRAERKVIPHRGGVDELAPSPHPAQSAAEG